MYLHPFLDRSSGRASLLVLAFAALCLAGAFLIGCGVMPMPNMDTDAGVMQSGDLVWAPAVPHPDMAPCPVQAAGDICCALQSCDSGDGGTLVCLGGFGLPYPHCELCGHAGGNIDACNRNLNDCGQPCCSGYKCSTGECMQGHGLTLCFDSEISGQRCGRAGEACCTTGAFCVLGLACRMLVTGAQVCQ